LKDKSQEVVHVVRQVQPLSSFIRRSPVEAAFMHLLGVERERRSTGSAKQAAGLDEVLETTQQVSSAAEQLVLILFHE
jgi:hypothetical protein